MIQKPKGTLDLYDKKGYLYNYLSNYISNFMMTYNYEFVKTPTFEHSELFKRGVGETTDIVSKETYDFKDKSDRDLTLRPEGTAGVARMVLENKLYGDGIVNKFYYISNVFRYERPQSGRFREHTQFGIEVFGDKTPYMDAEVISVAYRFLGCLGLKNLKVKINSIGDSESRKNHKEAMLKYFENKIDKLCDTCKERFKTNPLRILDCKEDSESEILKNAPKTIDYLNEESLSFFNKVKESLKILNIPYEIDKNLVRGLDYYTDTVFEIVSDLKELGPASTVCGGGRYNHLIKTLDGPDIPGIGFGLGLERLITIIESENINVEVKKVDLFIMNLSESDDAFILCDELRSNGFITEIDYSNRSMKSQFKLVEKINPTYIIIVGEDEIKGNYLTLKDNLTKENIKVEREELIDFLRVNL